VGGGGGGGWGGEEEEGGMRRRVGEGGRGVFRMQHRGGWSMSRGVDAPR
jgi:hypothetical protein